MSFCGSTKITKLLVAVAVCLATEVKNLTVQIVFQSLEWQFEPDLFKFGAIWLLFYGLKLRSLEHD